MRAQSTNNEKTGARSTPDAGADVTRNAKGRRVASVGILAGFAMLVRALIGWIIGLALTIMLVLAGLLVLWRYVPPVSTLMIARFVTLRPVERSWVPLEQISPHLVAAVISSEDARFCRHNGIDWDALTDQLNADDGPSRGASTIVMQTAKNLFLWPQKSVIRKALEIPVALAIDIAWPKRRILEVYLNIAEWGDNGLFGAQAASRRYFDRNAKAITRTQAALMATALPNPVLRRVNRPSQHHRRLARIIARRAADSGSWLDCLKP